MSEPAADPYAAARDRLFETVKWLASTLGAVTGALATGLALTALPELKGEALCRAALAAGAGLAALLGGIGVLLWVLLNPPFALAAMLDTEAKKTRLAPVVPRGYSADLAGLNLFLAAHQAAVTRLNSATAEDTATGARANATEAEKLAARQARNEAANQLIPLEAHMRRITGYGSLLALRHRVGWAMGWLGGLTLIGFGCLAVVAYQIGAAETKPPPPLRSLTIELR